MDDNLIKFPFSKSQALLEVENAIRGMIDSTGVLFHKGKHHRFPFRTERRVSMEGSVLWAHSCVTYFGLEHHLRIGMDPDELALLLSRRARLQAMQEAASEEARSHDESLPP